MKYHLGCGPEILKDYLNVDLQQFSGVDLVTDLSRPNLPDGISEVFSNAFYEHLHLKDRIPHIRSVYKSLAPNGFINYMGIPWFPGIADAYLHGAPGTIPGRTFDLYHAYRYTHGAPDEAGEYLPQLHKGLFDLPEFNKIFDEAGVSNHCVYTYCYPGEPTQTRVTCGFYASKDEFHWSAVVDYLAQWHNKYINIATVKFE